MIYTITFNPAIDYVVHVDDMKIAQTNRSQKEEIYYGGKGINVSIVLKELGYISHALGFIAGFTGEELVKGISKKGIVHDFITVKDGMTRINVKIRSQSESEINCSGPVISEEDVHLLYTKLDQLESGDILVLSGSIPKSLPDTIYQDIMAFLQNKGIMFVVDATGELLLNVLPFKPFLIKPNHFELEEIFHVKLKDKEEIIHYAKKLQEQGARNVLISMAGDGSILVDENNEVHTLGVPEGTVKNSVGAGDSMVAGFIAGYLKYQNYHDALLLASACGSATAYSDDLAKRIDIERLYQKIK